MIYNRAFSSLNWRRRPLRTYATIVNCIANTHTYAGLTVQSQLDTTAYPKIRVDDETMAGLAGLALEPEVFHPGNYVIKPQAPNA